MPPDPVFGAMVGAHHVDDALVTILKNWDRTYLQEVARRSDENVDELRPFRNWRVSFELEKMPEDTPPVCIIANRGINEPPKKHNSRQRPGQSYEAVWLYRIGCLLSARGKKINASPRAERLAKMYTLAIRTALVQKRDEYEPWEEQDRILGMIDWVDEGYDALESDADRTICLAWADFLVTVPEAATWGTGPRKPVPEPDPGDPNIPVWPVVEKVLVDIVKVPTNQQIPQPVPPTPVPPATTAFQPAFSEAFGDGS